MLHVMHSISACKKELHVHVILHIQGNQAKQSRVGEKRFPFFFPAQEEDLLVCAPPVI
jgi:hypothetical protein